MQPELYAMALQYAGAMLFRIAGYVLFFICTHKKPSQSRLAAIRKGNVGASNRGALYRLARMGVAVAGPIFFVSNIFVS